MENVMTINLKTDGINYFLEKHTKLSQEEMESLIRHIKN